MWFNMSDKKQAKLYSVKNCRSCLTIVSIVVIICQTLMSNYVMSMETELDTMDVIPLVPIQDAQESISSIITTIDDVWWGDSTGDNVLIVLSWDGGSWLSDPLVSNHIIQDYVWDDIVQSDPIYEATGSIENNIVPISGIQEMSVLALPQLHITEIRIDGTDEYVEITNWWPLFSGEIQLVWIKWWSTILSASIYIDTYQSVVIGDSWLMIVWSSWVFLPNQWLSMTDTSALIVSLVYGGQVLDMVQLSAEQVKSSDNRKASWEYSHITKDWLIATGLTNYSIITWEYGNPGVVRWLTRWVVVVSYPTITWSDIIMTWSSWDWVSGDMSISLIWSWWLWSWSISSGTDGLWWQIVSWIVIQEVYPFSDCIGEHIGLFFGHAYSWTLSVGGLWVSQSSKTFSVRADTWSIRYIVESLSGIVSDNVILVPDITLTDWGESLSLVGMSWLLWDSIIYTQTQSKFASTVSSSSWGVRLFASVAPSTLRTVCNQSIQSPQVWWCRIHSVDEWYHSGVFSMWFTVSGSLVSPSCDHWAWFVNGDSVSGSGCLLWESFVPWSYRVWYQQYSGNVLVCEDEYMIYGAIHVAQAPVVEPPSCAISIQNTTPITAGKSVNFIALLNDNPLQNTSSYQCQWSGAMVEWRDSCNPGYNTFNESWLIPLSLTISKDNKVICQTSMILNYPAWWIETKQSPSTYYEDLYRKRKEKHQKLATSVRARGCTVNSQDIIGGSCGMGATIQTWSIITDGELVRMWFSSGVSISTIIADPPGRDTDGGELIELTWDDVFSVPMILVINNKANRIVAPSSGTQHIYDSFPLPNKWWCVALTDMTIVYDHVCYGVYTQWDVFVLENLKLTKSLQSQLTPPSIKEYVIDEIELLELDLQEQKLINQSLKSEYRTQVQGVWDQYRSKTNEQYLTYRSITDRQQSYINYLQERNNSSQQYLQTVQSYATRITDLYRQSKEFRQQYHDINRNYQSLVYQLQNSYPAVRVQLMSGDQWEVLVGGDEIDTTPLYVRLWHIITQTLHSIVSW